MPTPDDLTPDAFARLSALEQSQELLRRAEFEAASSRVRHAAALDRHQADLERHEAMLARQTQTMADLAALQTRLADRQDEHAAHQQDHAQRMAQLQLILEAILQMLRDRNGH